MAKPKTRTKIQAKSPPPRQKLPETSKNPFAPAKIEMKKGTFLSDTLKNLSQNNNDDNISPHSVLSSLPDNDNANPLGLDSENGNFLEFSILIS